MYTVYTLYSSTVYENIHLRTSTYIKRNNEKEESNRKIKPSTDKGTLQVRRNLQVCTLLIYIQVRVCIDIPKSIRVENAVLVRVYEYEYIYCILLSKRMRTAFMSMSDLSSNVQCFHKRFRCSRVTRSNARPSSRLSTTKNLQVHTYEYK